MSAPVSSLTKLCRIFLIAQSKSSNNEDIGAVSDVRTLIFAWLVEVEARLFFYHTRRSYGMVIGDDFLGRGLRVRPGEPRTSICGNKLAAFLGG